MTPRICSLTITATEHGAHAEASLDLGNATRVGLAVIDCDRATLFYGSDHERRLIGAHAFMDHSWYLGVAILGDPVVTVAQRDHGAVGSHGCHRLFDHGLHNLSAIKGRVDQAVHLVEDCRQTGGIGLGLEETSVVQCALVQLITLGRQLLAGRLQLLGSKLEPPSKLFDARLLGELGLASGVGAHECNRSCASALGLLAQGLG